MATTNEQSVQKNTISRTYKGTVVRNAMDKTVVVKVDRVKTHPKYKKSYVSSKNYKVHDERNHYQEGDVVTFVQCRPLSKDKRWRVLYS